MMLVKIYIISLMTQQIWALTSVFGKRELFREDVLPQLGGKIPESAFSVDRLLLNRLNQNGFHTTDDGQFFKQRYPGTIYHGFKNHQTATLKISNEVDTTYTINAPIKNYLNYPYAFQYQQLPLFPIDSLQLIKQNKQQTDLNGHTGQQIFSEFKPLLQKLHDASYL